MQKVLISKVVDACSVGAPSDRVARTSLMFGLGPQSRHAMTIVSLVEIPLPQGGVVLVTGPSGGGKSTILSLLAAKLGGERSPRPVVRADDLPDPVPGTRLIDFMADISAHAGRDDLKHAMGLLSLVGLADAFAMLRTFEELSDGQRSRAMIARLLARADAIAPSCASAGAVILVDEFAATLDRLTAKAVARNLRRRVDRAAGCRHTLVCATTHDDVLEPLRPDVLVWKGLGCDGQVEVMER